MQKERHTWDGARGAEGFTEFEREGVPVARRTLGASGRDPESVVTRPARMDPEQPVPLTLVVPVAC